MTGSSHSVADRLAEYVVYERSSRLPEEVLRYAKRAVIDWHAAMYAGMDLEPVPILQRALADEVGRGAGVLAWGGRATIRAAAFLNGVASHAAEVDDVFREGVYHAGSPVIAAALALSKQSAADGATFLRAVIAGYEVSTRISAAILNAHYKYWHPTGTVGCIGAAAAAGLMTGLDRQQLAHAFATALTFASGLQQAFRSDSMTKPLHAGHAAEIGVMTAMAAAHGLTGASGMFEGAAGFGAAMGGNPDWAAALAGLGSAYNITRMTVKNHCCCGQAFAAIDAALAVRSQPQFRFDDIDEVAVETYETAVRVAGSHKADAPSEARFSIPYVVARALSSGSVRLDAFDAGALADPGVRGLMARVSVCEEPRYSAMFPQRRCATVTVKLRSGTRLRHAQTTRKGDPDAPLTDAELEGKFFELTRARLSRDRAERLLSRLRTLEQLPNLELDA
jgi:2-methylcitrate dehydratase PrpD